MCPCNPVASVSLYFPSSIIIRFCLGTKFGSQLGTILLTQDSWKPWQNAVQCQVCTYKTSRSCSPVGHLSIVPLMLTHQKSDSPPSTILSSTSITSAGPGD